MALYEHLDRVPKPHAAAASIVDFTFGMNVQVGWLHPSVRHAATICACTAGIPELSHSVQVVNLAGQCVLIGFSCACPQVHQPQLRAGLPWLRAA